METRPGRVWGTAARSSVMEGAGLGHHGMRRFRGGNTAVGNVCSIGCVWKPRVHCREEADMTGLGAAHAEAL